MKNFHFTVSIFRPRVIPVHIVRTHAKTKSMKSCVFFAEGSQLSGRTKSELNVVLSSVGLGCVLRGGGVGGRVM